MFWQYNSLVCSWRADVAVVSFNTPSRENTKYGDRFHPNVSPDAEAVVVDVDGRPAGSEQKKKKPPDGKTSLGQKGACVASLWPELFLPLSR